MTDASFRSAGYALMIEDNPGSENTVKAENKCPRGIWLKNFLLAQLNMSIYSKEILAT